MVIMNPQVATRIYESPSLAMLGARRKEILHLAGQRGVSKIRIFGSVDRGDPNPNRHAKRLSQHLRAKVGPAVAVEPAKRSPFQGVGSARQATPIGSLKGSRGWLRPRRSSSWRSARRSGLADSLTDGSAARKLAP